MPFNSSDSVANTYSRMCSFYNNCKRCWFKFWNFATDPSIKNYFTYLNILDISRDEISCSHLKYTGKAQSAVRLANYTEAYVMPVIKYGLKHLDGYI